MTLMDENATCMRDFIDICEERVRLLTIFFVFFFVVLDNSMRHDGGL